MICDLARLEGALSNPFPDDQTLKQVFDTLADWEQQLQTLPPEHLAYIVDNIEEPAP